MDTFRQTFADNLSIVIGPAQTLNQNIMYLPDHAHRTLTKAMLALSLALSICSTSFSQCFLETRGTQITTNQGVNVILRAVNLGNWALQEGYMLHPQLNPNPVNCQWKMKKKYYDQGQTEAQVEAFYAS